MQEATPDELVTAVQLWAERPVPSVSTTVCPAIGAPLEVVSTELRVSVWFHPVLVWPVYLTVVGALLTTTVLVPLLGNRLVVRTGVEIGASA